MKPLPFGFVFSHDLLSRYTNDGEQSKRFKTHNFDSSLLHLKTIKVINFDGSLSGNKFALPLVEYLLKNATVLEKFVIAAKFEGSDVYQDCVKMELLVLVPFVALSHAIYSLNKERILWRLLPPGVLLTGEGADFDYSIALQYTGHPVYDDGRYEEEAQKNVRGDTWERHQRGLLFSLLSLPVPQAIPMDRGMNSAIIPNYLEQKMVQKLLLLGLRSSGTNTFKLRVSWKQPLSHERAYYLNDGGFFGCLFRYHSISSSLFTQTEKEIHDFVTSTHKELHYWRSCHKIGKFSVFLDIREDQFLRDVDLWVYFATKLANVEDFTLGLFCINDQIYEFPQFAYKNTSLRNLVLRHCQLNPSGSINWRNLVSLSIMRLNLTEGVMEKVLSGCPNLECLQLDYFWGIHHLEISNVKLRKLILINYETDGSDVWLEILAPYIQSLQLMGSCSEIRLRNVASLITSVLFLDFDYGDGDEWQKESSCLKQLLHSIARVENLELGPWCIECMSIVELKGWKPPPSSRKSLQLNRNFEQLDLPGICRFLQSSPNLETLVIDGFNRDTRDLVSKYTNEDERSRRFETHNFNCSLLHLKTIKIISFYGPLRKNKSVLSSVKYLLKHATVLEKLVIAARYKGTVTSQDYVKMELQFPRFPRSSPHASFIFSY
ncbi:uncharacterized protein LOC132065634 [Lycium ferocissimum]|uniref:uncharacterized protein LOC132065634 n=1 Tax=Lycium ferocissimum TaxID=112874 RepID=UPI0028153D1A|nr:uncharacterized protein LOC132065634 [Lycium ferocissimum]